VISLQVKPYEGGLYAVDFDGNLYRVPVNASAVNVLADGVAAGWPFITKLGSNTQTLAFPDLSFKPTYVARDQPHTYDLWARSRIATKLFSLNTLTNPAEQTPEYNNLDSTWVGYTWDNHGRFIYGATPYVADDVQSSKRLVLFNVADYDPAVTPTTYSLCSGTAVIPEGTFIDMFTRYDESIVGATESATQLSIFTVSFVTNADGVAQCNSTSIPLPKSAFLNSQSPENVISVLAVAFDDTICLTAAGGPNSNGGHIPGRHTGGGSNNGGGSAPNPPATGPPPQSVTHVQGGSAPGSHAAGTTDNGVLTGGTGSVATAVVSVIGSSAVAAFAVFAVVLGLNNTKNDPPANLSAALISTEANVVASDNPIFQGLNDAGTNVLAG